MATNEKPIFTPIPFIIVKIFFMGKNDFDKFRLSVTNLPLLPVDDFLPMRGWKFDFEVASFLSAKVKKLCNVMQDLVALWNGVSLAREDFPYRQTHPIF